MTTATSSDMTLPLLGGRHHFLLRRLHSLTGIIFGGYLVVHLIVNAALIQGYSSRDVYQVQVDKIHSLPFLLAVEWLFIYLPILYHGVYGTWITFTAEPNVQRYPYVKNWFYTFQRISAIVLVFFIAFHVLGMKGVFWSSKLAFDPEHATASTVRHINASWVTAYLIYPIGILASCYHTANGFWTAGITWGLTISAQGQRRWGKVCGGLFFFLLACGLLALFAVLRDANSVNQMLNTVPRR
ncbi:MAG: sdhC [Phycisphaerales bacterium]|nr:sdhC [Phycisphaerales bacterium]